MYQKLLASAHIYKKENDLEEIDAHITFPVFAFYSHVVRNFQTWLTLNTE